MNIIDTGLAFTSPLIKRKKTDKIILHHTAWQNATVEQIHNDAINNNGWLGIGYHIYVRYDGTVFQGRPLDTVGAHCSGQNSTSIGVAFEGNYEYLDKEMPQAQYNTGIEVLKYIKSIYGDLPIYGHKDFYNTVCPGRWFPLSDFQALKGGESVAKWYDEVMEWAQSEGLIEGDERGLRPEDNITRAEAVTIIKRVVDKYCK